MENNLIKIPTPQQVHQIVMRLLARREHSRLELQQKLQQRGYSLELINQQLEKLTNQGLLSEERFVENYIRSRSNKGYGPIRIMLELQQRGINEHTIANFIESAAKDWLVLAEQVRQKRFGRKVSKNFSERAKQIRFLQHRGFTIEHINELILS